MLGYREKGLLRSRFAFNVCVPPVEPYIRATYALDIASTCVVNSLATDMFFDVWPITMVVAVF